MTSTAGAIMADYLQTLRKRLYQWGEDACERGWLPAVRLAELDTVTTATPDDLFSGEQRPLVVGLFGGTGVGKSSLLNRLAGAPVARVSAERPTSRAITLYVHESIIVSRLPQDFPTARLATTIHQVPHYRNVLWIDMPDFDSVESSHRRLVEQWLPHIDVLLYVVSPERYRDDTGWRMLLEHGHRHAWMFVINHWDQGDDRQLEDFRQVLERAGLDEPRLFRTDCRTPAELREADDFIALEATIQELAGEQLIRQLEARGVMQRLRDLKRTGDRWCETMGPVDGPSALRSHWQQHWPLMRQPLERASRHRIALLAKLHDEAPLRWPSRLDPRRFMLPSKSPEPPGLPSADELIDQPFLDRLDAGVSHFVHDAPLHGVPVAATERHFSNLRALLADDARASVADALAQALENPGPVWRRKLYQSLNGLSAVLPAAALAWVAFRVVNEFRLGAGPEGEYLGSNFAVHSALLVGVAWALPAFLAYRSKPSRSAAAASGMQRGLVDALDATDEQVRKIIGRLRAERLEIDARYSALWSEEQWVDDQALPVAIRRLLIPGDAPSSSPAAVRATTQSSTAATPVS